MRRVLCLALFCASVAGAQVRPAPGTGDPRIQTVAYNVDQVVQLQVASGYQLSVEFAPGERIETVAVGDSGAWSVTPNKRGDHLFIRALAMGVTTNLTVVTDAHTYTFELLPAYGTLPDLAWTVRFTYPACATAVAADADVAMPGRYRLGGTHALRPEGISDDGVKTYIDFAPGRALPAVFAVDAAGREVLVEGAMRDGQYVIDGVKAKLVFRIDRNRATATRVRVKD